MTRQEIIDALESMHQFVVCYSRRPLEHEPSGYYDAVKIIKRLNEGEEIETARETEINQALEDWIEKEKKQEKPGPERNHIPLSAVIDKHERRAYPVAGGGRKRLCGIPG